MAELATSPNTGPFGALRSRDFRLFWIGYVVAVAGQQVLWMTQGWLIYELTGSKLMLGATAIAQALPATVLTVFGGVVADKVDQRRLLFVALLLQALLLAGLAALCFTQAVEVWHILGVAFVLAAVEAFEQPARQALFPHLVERTSLTSAVGLNSTIHPGTRMFGPLIGGIVLAQVMDASSSAMTAAGATFSVAALGFATYGACLGFVHVPPIVRARAGSVWASMREGLQFIWRNRTLGLLIGATYFNMFFGMSMSVLYPVFAKDILGVGPSGLGLLYTAQGIGSLLGGLLVVTWASSVRPGLVMVAGSLCLGLFMVLFALSRWYPLSLLFLGLSAAGSSLFSVAVQTSLQLLVPDTFRGRVMGIWGMVHSAVRSLGEMQLAGLAAIASASLALLFGGAMVIGFAVVFTASNRLVRELDAASSAT